MPAELPRVANRCCTPIHQWATAVLHDVPIRHSTASDADVTVMSHYGSVIPCTPCSSPAGQPVRLCDTVTVFCDATLPQK